MINDPSKAGHKSSHIITRTFLPEADIHPETLIIKHQKKYSRWLLRRRDKSDDILKRKPADKNSLSNLEKVFLLWNVRITVSWDPCVKS